MSRQRAGSYARYFNPDARIMMDQLPMALLRLIAEMLSKRWARVFVFLGVSSFIIFVLIGTTCLFIYMYVTHDSEMVDFILSFSGDRITGVMHKQDSLSQELAISD